MSRIDLGKEEQSFNAACISCKYAKWTYSPVKKAQVKCTYNSISKRINRHIWKSKNKPDWCPIAAEETAKVQSQLQKENEDLKLKISSIKRWNNELWDINHKLKKELNDQRLQVLSFVANYRG